MAGVPTALLWFRRDLRLSDHPALVAAIEAAGPDGTVVPVFVVDPRLWGPSGRPRRQFLRGCLADLREQTGGALVIRSGDPTRVVADLVRETGAGSVHVSFDAGVYGRGRDAAVEEALGDVPFVRTGSPYGVTPGRLTKSDGTPFKVYSPFARAWRARGVHSPARRPDDVPWADGVPTEDLPPAQDLGGTQLPAAGEAAGHEVWAQFRDQRLLGYATARNAPGADATSRLSAHLKYGTLHPRTLFAEAQALADEHAEAVEKFTGELIWRDFYADVLWHRPETAREPFNPQMKAMQYDTGPVADEHFAAWAEGRTGYPIVDAGMRQLRGEAYVHNRVRMVVASFLVKDLHIDWRRGARHFFDHLVDGDLASNNHGWQWVAGTGTDAAPYFRVFNPVSQSRRFDPDGTYLATHVPELAGLAPDDRHEPWLARAKGADLDGYPEPIDDHAAERQEALRRYEATRAR